MAKSASSPQLVAAEVTRRILPSNRIRLVTSSATVLAQAPESTLLRKLNRSKRSEQRLDSLPPLPQFAPVECLASASAGAALGLLAVKLFDHFFERVLAYVHNGDFALRAFFGVTPLGGVDHDGLAEFAPDRAGRRLRRVGRTEDVANLSDGFHAFVGNRDGFLRARFLPMRGVAISGGATVHEHDDVLKLIVGKRRRKH